MRILFVIDTYDTNNNGTSISAQRFAAELRQRGHEVKILTSGEPGDDRFVLHFPTVDGQAQLQLRRQREKDHP